MELYRSKLPWFSGFANEPEPEWLHDYEEPEEIEQRGTGNEALDNAFSHSHYAGRGMRLGDVVGLDTGELYRCEMSGWTELPEKLWTARVQRGQGRFLER